MKCVILDWSNLHMHGDLWWRLLSHRYDVFVAGLGWEVPTATKRRLPHGEAVASVEFDQYDGPFATYVVALDDAGEIQASARLLRTDTSYRFGPYNVSYMIKDACAGLLDNIPANLMDQECPATTDTWELTRYTSRSRQASKALFEALNRFLANANARNVLTLSAPSFVRWLKAIKFKGELIGPEIMIDGQGFAVVSTAVDYVAAGLSESVRPMVAERAGEALQDADSMADLLREAA
ncbi:acyl-homoserine-lactone synthase [Pikeienuella sp. HZG-20]|uniref:acyl-homoserine-lactone synthase n=1 Tax=Paludibacillus litoralis TaxID=3133267 RepID=UPI0030ECDD9D